MKKNLFFYAALGLLLFVASCKGKDALTKTDMISRAWLADEAFVKAANITVIVYKRGAAQNANPNIGNFRLTFSKDGNLSGIDMDNTPFTGAKWKFINNETEIEISEPNDTQRFKLVSLSESNLEFSQIQVSQGQSLEVTIKMIAQ